MRRNDNIKALKSGIWYTLANFITKGIGFLTTPIFTRLLSRNEYGLYSNYNSWLSTFTIFATLNLGSTFISARFDHEKDFDGYISSVLALSSGATIVFALLFNIFSTFFSSLTGVSVDYLNIMVVYMLLYSAVDMFQVRERYYYKYKVSVAISLLISVSTAFLSIVLVLNLENKLLGRVLGSATPTVLLGIILYIVILFRGKKVKLAYWKYALPICLPYIPHLLSLTLLNSMDKMMITKICGAEDNALYSVAYSCGAIITMLITSMNTAFSPWLGEHLNDKDYSEIRKISKYYIYLFVYASCGIILLSPELILIMGGKGYEEAIYVMPPVAFSCVCQFLYTLYVNVEQFSKKTVGMAIASAIAAGSNYILNAIFIPRYGYIAAAYTTLISFAILLLIHMLLVNRLGLLNVYPTKCVVVSLCVMSAYTAMMYLLYLNTVVRYSIIVLYMALSLILIIKNKKHILAFVNRSK